MLCNSTKSALVSVEPNEKWLYWLKARPNDADELRSDSVYLNKLRFQLVLKKVPAMMLIIDPSNPPQKYEIILTVSQLPLTNFRMELEQDIPLTELPPDQCRFLGEVSWSPGERFNFTFDSTSKGDMIGRTDWYPINKLDQVIIKRFEVSRFSYDPLPSTTDVGAPISKDAPLVAVMSMRALLSLTDRRQVTPTSHWHVRGQPLEPPEHVNLLCHQLAASLNVHNGVPADVMIRTTLDYIETFAHRFVLQMRSSFFAAYFTGRSLVTELEMIELDNVSGRVMAVMIAYMYGQFPPTDWTNYAEEVAIAAAKYGIQELANAAVSYLTFAMKVETAAQVLYLADAVNVPGRLFWKVEKKVQEVMNAEYSAFMTSAGFQEIAQKHFNGDQKWVLKMVKRRLNASASNVNSNRPLFSESALSY